MVKLYKFHDLYLDTHFDYINLIQPYRQNLEKFNLSKIKNNETEKNKLNLGKKNKTEFWGQRIKMDLAGPYFP